MFEVKHGTINGYNYEVRHKLPRCEACRVAKNEYMRDYKKGKLPPKKPLPPHGTRARYQHHMRNDRKPCFKCRLASAEYTAEWRKKQNELDSVHTVDDSNDMGSRSS